MLSVKALRIRPDSDGMNVSSVAAAAVSLKSAETAFQTQVAVAGKLLENQRTQGDAVVQLLQAATDNLETASSDLLKAVGGNLDIRA